MAGKVLVDTSVWIDHFRVGKAKSQIELLLREQEAVYSGVIALELLRGAKGKKELEILEALFESISSVEETRLTFIEAGRMGQKLARLGLTTSAIDLLIAQTAIENSLTLFTYDIHFPQIAQHLPLKLFSAF